MSMLCSIISVFKSNADLQKAIRTEKKRKKKKRR